MSMLHPLSTGSTHLHGEVLKKIDNFLLPCPLRAPTATTSQISGRRGYRYAVAAGKSARGNAIGVGNH